MKIAQFFFQLHVESHRYVVQTVSRNGFNVSLLINYRQSVERLFSTTFARADNHILGFVDNENLKYSTVEELGGYRVYDTKRNRPT